MKLHYRLSVLLTAAALAVTTSCGTSVQGSASAGDETTTSSTASTTDASPSEEAPTTDAPSGESTVPDVPVDDPPADVDPVTLAWADASCQDLMAMAETYVAFPDVDGDASPEEYAIANIDFYDSLGTVINDRLADIQTRQAPRFPRGDEVHDVYANYMNVLGTAAAQGAVDIELMHRSGSPEDLAASIDRVQTSVEELASADFAAEFMDDVELSSTMEAAMAAAPNCAALG